MFIINDFYLWIALTIFVLVTFLMSMMFFKFWRFKKVKTMKKRDILKKKGVPFFFKNNSIITIEEDDSLLEIRMKLLFTNLRLLFCKKEITMNTNLSKRQKKFIQKKESLISKKEVYLRQIENLQIKKSEQPKELEDLIFNKLQEDSFFKTQFLKTNLKDATEIIEIKKLLSNFPEEKARFEFVFEMLKKYDFNFQNINFELPVKFGSKTGFVDISFHEGNQPPSIDNAVCFIEMKKNSVKDLGEATKQLHSYMSVVPNVKLGIVSNGKAKLFFEKVNKENKIVFDKTENFLQSFNF